MAPGERPQRDSIAEVFNYDQVRDAIHRLIDGRHINLQETLVEEIADLCFGFDAVVAVRVSSEKTDVYDDCASVGSEVVRLREA
jgi:dihydroneopterin aldolase